MAGREKIDADGQILRICSGRRERKLHSACAVECGPAGSIAIARRRAQGIEELQYGTSDGDGDDDDVGCDCDEKVKSSPRIVENRSPIVELQRTIELALSQSQR